MDFKNTDQEYGAVSKLLHWGMALIILFLLSVGFYMSAMAFSPLKLEIYGLHKSFGMLVLLLFGVRIFWRTFSAAPAHIDGHADWERWLAKFIHLALYICMIGMPLSGWFMSSAGEFPNIFFGLFEFPALSGKDEALFKIMRTAHEVFALGLIALIGLHMVGALKHHFIDDDVTLRRMTRRGLGFVGAGLIAFVGGALLALAAGLYISGDVDIKDVSPVQAVQVSEYGAHVSDSALGWNIDVPTSHIHFDVTQYGEPFSGGFKNFSGQIIFDPENLSEASVNIEVDIGSLFTGSGDRDAQARTPEWFDVAAYPRAVFSATNFRVRKAGHDAPKHYEARGELSLRGKKLPVILPFSLYIVPESDGGKKAIMDAALILKRLDYGVGQGQWQSTAAIGNDVILDIHVEARQP